MKEEFARIEEKWQKKWEEARVFEAKDNQKPKFYVLEMFPYPSAEGLHMGHSFNFVIGDIYARYKKMNGFNVLHPMGFDALGLPAENAAIKYKRHPEEYTQNSIKNFIRQQKRLGLSYDWSRMIDTSNPSYYKWDQWIFLKMFEKGLAYQKVSAVNWCPSCQTVLANEQAQNGKCERCESRVQIRHLKQWFLKITKYADELYEEIDKLNWPEKTKAMQKNWIGKSIGTEIDFEINGEKWPIFTTRPDTIFGVTFMVISAHHKDLFKLVTREQKEEVEKFLNKIGSVSQKTMKEIEDLDKEGVFTGSFAINPANNEKVPVYVGNFVVADYGCGMVMAVPAHDQRDFEFAKRYSIPIKYVIKGEKNDISRAYTEEGIMINSSKFNGLKSQEAREQITEWLISKKVARRVTNFKLRDWGISRQRYWGTPIPIIHCEKCGVVPVKEKDLPVTLPKDVKFSKGNPLETAKEWLETTCPKCNRKAKRETDTMDTFVNSSWYFLRYCDPKNEKEIFNKEKAKFWCPIDLYIGGSEHACMHLIYSRFYVRFLRDIGLLDFSEPAIKLFHQGMINDEKGEKMSKSKGNVVEPINTIEKYGTDTTRFYLVSVASPDRGFNWTEDEINGSLRFIRRVVKFFENFTPKEDKNEVLKKLNETIAEVTESIENIEYRRATIKLRELFDIIEKNGASRETAEKFLKLLNPFCPHITEEFWEKLGNKEFLCNAKWPEKEKMESKKKEECITDNLIRQISNVLAKMPNKKRIYIYTIPFEYEKIDIKKIKKEFEIEVIVQKVNDPNKYDPENKSKKSKPGLPSFYIE